VLDWTERLQGGSDKWSVGVTVGQLKDFATLRWIAEGVDAGLA